jgi:divalent metal cation (Fe/Co/Zn/Cd) transporter
MSRVQLSINVSDFNAAVAFYSRLFGAAPAVFEPALGVAKQRIGARLGSSATAGEGTQNLLCAYLAMAVFAGLAANTLWGVWWLDGVVALGIAGWAVVEGRRAWAGRSCDCACQPAAACGDRGGG